MDILHTFGIDLFLLSAQIANFLVLLFLLKRMLYKPLIKTLETRKKKIEDSIKNAAEIEKRLQKMDEEKLRRRKEAQAEVKLLIEDAKKSAQEIISKAHQKAAADIENLIKKNELAMRQEREKLYQEIKEEVSDLVVSSLEKVTGKALDNADQKRLIERSIKDL